MNVTVSIIGRKVTTDLYFQPTDSHTSSSHPYHSKNGISYSQALRIYGICSNPNSFDRRCNDLEKQLIERGYSDREVRKQILRVRGFFKKFPVG